MKPYSQLQRFLPPGVLELGRATSSGQHLIYHATRAHLGSMNIHLYFSAIFIMGNTFCDCLFASPNNSALTKWEASQGRGVVVVVVLLFYVHGKYLRSCRDSRLT